MPKRKRPVDPSPPKGKQAPSPAKTKTKAGMYIHNHIVFNAVLFVTFSSISLTNLVFNC